MTKSRHPSSTLGAGHVVLWCALIVTTKSASAQTAPSSNPAAAGVPESSDMLHLEPPDASLDLRSRYNSSSIKQHDIGETEKFRDTSVQEIFNLATSGWLLERKFFDFDASGSFGLEQRWEKINGVSDYANDTLYEYNFDGTLLPGSSTPLHLRAGRTIDFTSQPFSETYQTVTNNYEATWNLNSKQFPTYFRLYHNDFEQDSLSGLDDFHHDQNSAEWHSEAIFSPGNHLYWNYNFTSVNQTNQLGQTESYDANSFNLLHQYDFGSGQKNVLTSTLDYLSQHGAFAQERMRIDENLALHHSDRLESFYGYQFEQTRYPDVDTTLHRGTTGLHAKLFNGLESTGTIGALKMDQSSANTDEIFGNLNFDLTRNVPGGVLTGMLQTGLDHQANQAQETVVHVMTTKAFDAAQQIVLPFVGISSGSVQLRSASGTTFFAEGVDFTTIYSRDRAIITRIPGGAIGPDDSVLLDYEVDPKPANETTTASLNTGLRYDFDKGPLKGVGVYARYFLQQQNIDTDQPGAFIPDNVNALTYGAEYRIWRLRFNAEHEDHHSDIAPFESNLFSARYEDRIGREWRFAAAATHVRTMYEDDTSNPIVSTISGTLQYRPNQKFHAILALDYLDLEDEQAGTRAHGLEESLRGEWTLRDVTVQATIRHSDLDTDSDKSSFMFFYLNVERKF